MKKADRRKEVPQTILVSLSNLKCSKDMRVTLLLISGSPRLITAACRSLSSTGYNSPLVPAEVLRACGGDRVATAAPLPVSVTLQTVHAWPAAGVPLTWVAVARLAYLWDTDHRTQGVEASLVRGDAVRAVGWGWLRAGKGIGRGAVRLPAGLRGGVPQNLEGIQDIHHHLDAMGPVGAGVGVNGCASADGGVASHCTSAAAVCDR